MSQRCAILLAQADDLRQFVKGRIAPAALFCLKRQKCSKAPSDTALHRRKKNIRAVPHPALKGDNSQKHGAARGSGNTKHFRLTGHQISHTSDYTPNPHARNSQSLAYICIFRDMLGKV
ncbi:hypothetical protein [Agrobacterium rubi]|uniref:Uncharacterized protein n=1 Tax=Agrobacterium rubi TaxID=28099 RepID=A0AAE7QZC9_9HYPH|nr:hypothetical protein [Agrobacterium rubi]NTE86801.1 hypothetical protein [Agrobacterium rubi]NTF02735.1 hypothetical protein [Agrobacterium rubi]NTF36979.1 hypothetical protein [Agrobacterium rubi]QTF99417.1 hypothetical protein G6M88_02930 [Agrobacterium rubi]